MSLTTRVGLVAGAAALTLTGASFADQAEAQDYEARIAELEAQVSRMNGESWMTDVRADQIRGLVEDVLADVDTRSNLLQSGMTAGYDDGFVIGSSDGGFTLRMNGQMQARFIWNVQEESTPGSVDTSDYGFENTRTKLMFSGNVAGPEWTYHIEGDFRRAGGGFGLDDAYLSYDMGDGWSVDMGQFKAPVYREFLVHSSNQLAVERSSVVYNFAGSSRTQGIALHYNADNFHLVGSINDGAGAGGTVWSASPNEYALTLRGEMLFSGSWDQFGDFTSAQGSEQGLMVGAAVHHQKSEYGTAATEVETTVFTVDASFEFDGGNIFGAFYYSDTDPGTASPTGFVVQGGYYFQDDLEGFLRYEWMDFDTTGVEDLSLITVGINCYYTSNVKMTADVGFGLDNISAGGAVDIAGTQADVGTEDGQVIFRTQLQLTF